MTSLMRAPKDSGTRSCLQQETVPETGVPIHAPGNVDAPASPFGRHNGVLGRQRRKTAEMHNAGLQQREVALSAASQTIGRAPNGTMGERRAHISRVHWITRHHRYPGIGNPLCVQRFSISARWWSWIRSACLAAIIVFGIGTLTLGLPGALFLEVVAGSRLPADGAWPLAIGITQLGALTIVPASLALRFLAPYARGWQHAGLTALLSVVATFLFTIIVMPAQPLRDSPDPPSWMMVVILAIVFANRAAWYSIVALGLSAARARALYFRLSFRPCHRGVVGRTRPQGNRRRGSWPYEPMIHQRAATRKEKQWPRTRYASGTTRTPKLLPGSTLRRFPTAGWVPSSVHPVTTPPARRATS